MNCLGSGIEAAALRVLLFVERLNDQLRIVDRLNMVINYMRDNVYEADVRASSRQLALAM